MARGELAGGWAVIFKVPGGTFRFRYTFRYMDSDFCA